MRRIYFLLLMIHLFSCGNNNNEKVLTDETNRDTLNDKSKMEFKSDSIIEKKSEGVIPFPPPDTNGYAAQADKMKKVKIDITVFPNKDVSGFGYDIILDGHLYVHQPNIPALPGNNGFETETQARQVAELVAFKIQNNIMPPTVDVNELDSLGVRQKKQN